MGPINAVSPKYIGDSVQRFFNAAHKPPILWVRGLDDQIVSDESFIDFGTLGKHKKCPVPDYWPGDGIYPPQPMVSQTRAVLDKYQANAVLYWEKVIVDAAHTPYIEKPNEFMTHLVKHLELADRMS